MKLEVLISCMNQNDFSIIERSKVTTDALIINQTSANSYEELKMNDHKVRMISTTERGLSKSRNTAVENSKGDICLICDDDEIFDSNYEKLIIDAYRKIPDADIIAFKMKNYPSKLPNKIMKIRYLNSLRLSSWQISFRRESILKNNIKFDLNLGAGTGNGAGEENKFLIDCLKNNLRIYYVPIEIAMVAQEESTWFNGYTESYFIQRGSTTRYIMGLQMSVLYGIHFAITKRKIYRKEISTVKALKSILHGIIANPIGRGLELKL